MKRNLTLWGMGALIVVLLPLVFVGLEGLTRPDPLTAGRIADSPTDPQQPAVDGGPAVRGSSPVDLAADDTTEFADWSGGTEVGETPSAGAPGLPRSTLHEADESIRDSFISDLDYFGGGTDSIRGEDLVATVIGPDAKPEPEGGSPEGAAPKAPASNETVPEEMTGEKPGDGKKPEAGKPEQKKPDGPKKEKRERIEVTIIRPREDVVDQHDEIIGRCRGSRRFAVALVKPSQVGASWWVQESLPRQTTYFRARAQFGNGKTVDGSRFKVVVAFLPADAEIPETGTQFRELPAEFLLSQELEYTLKRK